MPLEYLVYLNAMLLTRLVYLVKDQRLGGRASIFITAIQCLLCLIIFQWNSTLVLILLCPIAFTGLGWFAERKTGNDKEQVARWRLMSLTGLALIPGALSLGDSFAFGPIYQTLTQVFLPHVPLLDINLPYGKVALIIFGLLIVANETNLAMRVILHLCNLEPKAPDTQNEETDSIDEEEFQAGRVIGILERWLVFLIVTLSGDLGAIGFIVAAKGLVRFNKFSDDKFAEYVLVGTLLSVLTSLAVAKWVSVIIVR